MRPDQQPHELGRRLDAPVALAVDFRERLVDGGARFGELAELELHLAELGKERQPERISFGEQRDGAAEQVRGGVHVAARERAPPRRREAPRAVAADLARLLVERPELAEVALRLLEVVAEDLLELEAAAALGVDLVGPANEVDVQGRPRALEDAVVDRVADQVVMEAVDRIVVRHRHRVHELLARERLQLVVDGRLQTLGGHRSDRRRRELQADHRRRLDRSALVDAELAEPCFEQRLDRRRDRELALVVGAHPAPVAQLERLALDEHRQDLLDVERVAFGRGDDAGDDVGGEPGRAEQVGGDVGGRRVAERPQHEAQRGIALAPLRALVENVMARGAEQEDRRLVGRAEDVLDQVEERLLGPMDVVDERDRRTVRRRATRRTCAPPTKSRASGRHPR